jgi:hypothetical protein
LLGLLKIANAPSDQSIVAPLKVSRFTLIPILKAAFVMPLQAYNSHIQGQVCEQSDLDGEAEQSHRLVLRADSEQKQP